MSGSAKVLHRGYRSSDTSNVTKMEQVCPAQFNERHVLGWNGVLHSRILSSGCLTLSCRSYRGESRVRHSLCILAWPRVGSMSRKREGFLRRSEGPRDQEVARGAGWWRGRG